MTSEPAADRQAPQVTARGEAAAGGERVLQLENVHTYYGNIHALKGVTMDVAPGEIVTLIGSNGAGKSTTLRTISGIERAREGTVRVNGRDTTKVPAHEIVALDVRELVKEHRPSPAVTPLFGARGKHNRRIDHAAGEGHLDQGAGDEPRHLIEVEAIGDLAEWIGPRALVERTSRANDASHRQRAEAKPSEETEHDRAPDREQRSPERKSRRGWGSR